MHLEWLFLTGPWAVALWAALVALLTLACLQALRRRREVVPGLAIFSRVRAQNLPPAPPPRWLDRSFVFKALLLGALTTICAGLALAHPQTAPRRVALLIDDGPAGQYRLQGGGTLSAVLQAAAEQTQKDPALAGAEIETVPLSSLTAKDDPRLTLTQAIELLQARVGGEQTGWSAMHVFTPVAPPADLAANVGSLQVVWHQPAGVCAPNLGIVRVQVEPAPAAATAQPGAAADGSDWLVWVEVVDCLTAMPAEASAWHVVVECQPLGVTPLPAPVQLHSTARGVVGPLALRLPADCKQVRLTAGWRSSGAAPTGRGASGDPQEGLAADDSITLQFQPGAAVSARVLGATDTPMVRAALTAWQVPVAADDAARPAATGSPGAVLLISDGGPQAAAELQVLRRAGRVVLPIYLNPALDVDGLQLPGGDAKPRPADKTFVPAGQQSTYGVLGRQPWQIAAVRPALLLYGGAVVVDSPVGPVVVRWVDPAGRPAWGLLFDPAQSSLAGRDTGGWLAFWQVVRREADALAAGGGADKAGGGWRIDRTATAAGVPDRALSELRLPPAGQTTTFGPPAPATGPAGGDAARTSATVTSLAGIAGALALVLLCLVIMAEAARAPADVAA